MKSQTYKKTGSVLFAISNTASISVFLQFILNNMTIPRLLSFDSTSYTHRFLLRSVIENLYQYEFQESAANSVQSTLLLR